MCSKKLNKIQRIRNGLEMAPELCALGKDDLVVVETVGYHLSEIGDFAFHLNMTGSLWHPLNGKNRRLTRAALDSHYDGVESCVCMAWEEDARWSIMSGGRFADSKM